MTAQPAAPSIPAPDTVTLTTARLLLRPYRLGDGAAYVEMWRANRDHLHEFMPKEIAGMRTAEDAKNQIQRMHDRWRVGALFIFGGWRQDTGAYVGETYLANADWAVPSIELGYFVVADQIRQGYAVEAGRAVTAFAFDRLGVDRVELQCASDNVASARVAETIGFRLEGRQRERHRKRDGSLVDRLWFGLLRSEWEGAEVSES